MAETQVAEPDAESKPGFKRKRDKRDCERRGLS